VTKTYPARYKDRHGEERTTIQDDGGSLTMADRACVGARGIEHVKGDNESPARNAETVITYGLRRSQRGWVIATWSQGWPRFGSADKLPEWQSWRDGWNLAE
jgi:hypothetical protein